MTGVEVWPDWDGSGACGDRRHVCVCVYLYLNICEDYFEHRPLRMEEILAIFQDLVLGLGLELGLGWG